MPHSTIQLTIHTDGGSRGNPGPAATGFVVFSADNSVLAHEGRYLGETTNNVAEYTAVIDALQWVVTNQTSPYPSLRFKLDSQLVVEQLLRHWQIKDANLKRLANQIWMIIQSHSLAVDFTHVPRALNKVADTEVNRALDAVLISS